MITLPEIQKALDRHVLQYMDDMAPRDYRNGYAFHLRCFEQLPWITKDMARAICRSLTDRGFATYVRGLMDDDGEFAGAGYGITPAGETYLDELCKDDNREANHDVPFQG